MKAINIADLKTHLSQYLRRVRAGERLLVTERHTPVAELIPVTQDSLLGWERLAREGLVQLGTQDRSHWKPTRVSRRVDLRKLLDEVREDTR